ncbi:Uncharacterised protein [Shewanella putrefaciens]|jgi:hypothetical protein|nr:Uncharacterised protein [Shewanella putrefaciens]
MVVDLCFNLAQKQPNGVLDFQLHDTILHLR